ncbi:hypothetical protein NB520_15485 [Vibrio antiquarius]|uniref:hypothetical protein n=1 Tax=Vibrio antiquarius (strain Ex25) TaxID=150340 RepID=UPI00265B3932|nr:hypothetical protein [Vibrio antiquarius]MCR9628877.1 hypothetical protein [Vibrio antiquarius]MCR9632910.1 hypothetical protein [Vibrio antiquarius]
MKNYFKSLFEEQPEERFFALKLTKVVLAIFSLLFIVTCAISANEAFSLELRLTSEGMNHLVFELFKAPVAIVAFILPILGLIGLNHRSEQLKKQIATANKQLEASLRQNLFTNYFKHLEEFTKHATNNIDKSALVLAALRSCHDYLFPNGFSAGDFTISEDARFKLTQLIKKTIADLKAIERPEQITEHVDDLKEISEFLSKFALIPPPVSKANEEGSTFRQRQNIINYYGTVQKRFKELVIMYHFAPDAEVLIADEVFEDIKMMNQELERIYYRVLLGQEQPS